LNLQPIVTRRVAPRKFSVAMGGRVAFPRSCGKLPVSSYSSARRERGGLARRLEGRGHDPHHVAHFLMRCMFCLFAEDARLLEHDLFSRALAD